MHCFFMADVWCLAV